VQRDLVFLSGDFTFVPKDKRYLTKYFKTRTQKMFLSYFILFGTYDNFVDHTGIYCQKRYMKILHDKLIVIENAHKIAKQNLDFANLVKIENGEANLHICQIRLKNSLSIE